MKNANIPTDISISDIMKQIGLYFFVENVDKKAPEIQSYTNIFKKNLLFHIYEKEFQNCSTIEEILDVEKKHNINEIEDQYMECFKLLPKRQNKSFQKIKEEGVYLIVASRYSYIESNNSIVNAFIVKWKGIQKEDILNKTDAYFAYLDVLRRLEEEQLNETD